ncbi:hypothetical protein [Natronorubrum sp. FCH18a]|uniref:hypothetical protein n=1 Tax=Natronorubrum sp. FCH18a TaxID=3447018 RepID=UPI003F5180E4
MNESRPTLMEDLERAGQESMPHLLGAVVSAVASLLVPIAGIGAAYSGYQLTTVMERSWFGLLFAVFGVVILGSWLVLVWVPYLL